ncbi:MAG: hypothetical protein ACFFEF_19780 [Candidatus Thorarchaeota archaeon]
MISETASESQLKINDELIDLIEVQRLSSLDMIAAKLGSDIDDVRNQIQEYIDGGRLRGSISEDGARFFSSNVKKSEAPIIRQNNEAIALETPDNRNGKYAMLLGLGSIIVGASVRGLGSFFPGIQNFGASMILIGIVTLAAGWLYISRRQVSIA